MAAGEHGGQKMNKTCFAITSEIYFNILSILSFCKICCLDAGMEVTLNVDSSTFHLCPHCVPSGFPCSFHLFLNQKPDTVTITSMELQGLSGLREKRTS